MRHPFAPVARIKVFASFTREVSSIEIMSGYFFDVTISVRTQYLAVMHKYVTSPMDQIEGCETERTGLLLKDTSISSISRSHYETELDG